MNRGLPQPLLRRGEKRDSNEMNRNNNYLRPQKSPFVGFRGLFKI